MGERCNDFVVDFFDRRRTKSDPPTFDNFVLFQLFFQVFLAICFSYKDGLQNEKIKLDLDDRVPYSCVFIAVVVDVGGGLSLQPRARPPLGSRKHRSQTVASGRPPAQ